MFLIYFCCCFYFIDLHKRTIYGTNKNLCWTLGRYRSAIIDTFTKKNTHTDILSFGPSLIVKHIVYNFFMFRIIIKGKNV